MYEITNSKDMFKRAHDGDKQAREQLIIDNLQLAYSIASKFINHKAIDFDTAKQQASLGLIKAVDTFDTDKGVKFSTYAYLIIESTILKFIRDYREDIPYRLARRDYTLYGKVHKAREKLKNELSCENDYDEMAKYLNINQDEIKQIITIIEKSGSMDKTIYRDKQGKDKITLKETIINQLNPSEDQLVDKIVLDEAIKQLNERERKVINLKYYRNKTQEEIGKIMGKSQVTISRTENAALNKLNKILKGEKIPKKVYKTKFQMDVNDYNLSLLTERQKKVALLLFEGKKTQKEAAEELGVTKSTIGTYVLDIKNKIRKAEEII